MDRPVFLLAPGAGASSAHPRMQRFAALLGDIGEVRPFDYPYMLAGRRRPDPLPQLVAAHRAAFEEARRHSGNNVILVGKSMGGRVGCHLALEVATPAVVCLGYPLCGGGDRSKLRDEVLRELRTPVLFIQGTRDPLCPLDLLSETRMRMQATNGLHVVENGDHSLVLSKTWMKATGVTQDQADLAIVSAIAKFLTRISGD